MYTIAKRATVYVAALLLTLGAINLATIKPAAAASVCGSGYQLLDSYAVNSIGHGFVPQGQRMATIDLYWNPYTRQNCMTTSAYGKAYGTPLLYNTAIGHHGYVQSGNGTSTGWDDYSNGVYRYYAGPDRTPRQGSGSYCLDIAVDIYSPTGSVVYASRYLYNVHC